VVERRLFRRLVSSEASEQLELSPILLRLLTATENTTVRPGTLPRKIFDFFSGADLQRLRTALSRDDSTGYLRFFILADSSLRSDPPAAFQMWIVFSPLFWDYVEGN